MHRFFAPALDPGDEVVTLPRDEGEHLTRVLRMGVGDEIGVFDGRGHEFSARVVSVERRDVRVQLVSRVEPAAEPAVALTLAQAVIKGDKMDDIVRDAVMLGVAAVQPLVTARTESTVAALTKGNKVDRWQRVALASVKQSKRAVLPDVRRPLTLEAFLGDPPAALRIMLVEPGAGRGAEAGEAGATGEAGQAGDAGEARQPEPLSVLHGQPLPQDATIFVGPEGGWTEKEIASARAHGVRLMTLGHRTLRADATPVAAISVLQFLFGDL